MSQQKIEQFHRLLEATLTANVAKTPERYAAKAAQDIPGTVNRMMEAIERNAFNSSISLRTVCSTLGIKFTIKSIREHLGYAYQSRTSKDQKAA